MRIPRYNLMAMALIALAAILIAGIWKVYEHKDEQIEKAIYLLK